MKILMVCLGNICRSPIADGGLRHLCKENNLNWEIDSAGTANYHVGSKPDSRMIKAAKNKGIDLNELRARQFSVSDFDQFDIIFAMDSSNRENILRLARNEEDVKKVRLFLNEIRPNLEEEVPDPYYGTEKDFNHVVDLVQAANQAFIEKNK